MKKCLFIVLVSMVMGLLGCNSPQRMAIDSQPDLQRFASMMLVEKATGDVDDMPYLEYLDSLGFKKSDADLRLGKLRLGLEKILCRLRFATWNSTKPRYPGVSRLDRLLIPYCIGWQNSCRLLEWKRWKNLATFWGLRVMASLLV